MLKTIILKREINGRIHQTTLKKDTSLHIDIVECLLLRCIKRNINIDVDDVINTVKEKY